jgi:hypothetical protein
MHEDIAIGMGDRAEFRLKGNATKNETLAGC